MNIEITPITNDIRTQFQTSTSAVLEASTLGWGPGAWPRCFYVMGIEGCFNFFRDIRHGGEFAGKEYQTPSGKSIVILND
jgi:hypothetical protein